MKVKWVIRPANRTVTVRADFEQIQQTECGLFRKDLLRGAGSVDREESVPEPADDGTGVPEESAATGVLGNGK